MSVITSPGAAFVVLAETLIVCSWSGGVGEILATKAFASSRFLKILNVPFVGLKTRYPLSVSTIFEFVPGERSAPAGLEVLITSESPLSLTDVSVLVEGVNVVVVPSGLYVRAYTMYTTLPSLLTYNQLK